jgi:NADPH:quinone reductase-like Zn-dependent oxidoreductase
MCGTNISVLSMSMNSMLQQAGVDVVLDCVGAPYLMRNLECLAVDGKLVMIGWLGGTKVEDADLGIILRKRLYVIGANTILLQTFVAVRLPSRHAGAVAFAFMAAAGIVGSTLRSRSDAFKAELVSSFHDGFAPVMNDLRPVVDRVFNLEQAAEAHRCMENGEHFGKIVLKVEQ